MAAAKIAELGEGLHLLELVTYLDGEPEDRLLAKMSRQARRKARMTAATVRGSAFASFIVRSGASSTDRFVEHTWPNAQQDGPRPLPGLAGRWERHAHAVYRAVVVLPLFDFKRAAHRVTCNISEARHLVDPPAGSLVGCRIKDGVPRWTAAPTWSSSVWRAICLSEAARSLYWPLVLPLRSCLRLDDAAATTWVPLVFMKRTPIEALQRESAKRFEGENRAAAADQIVEFKKWFDNERSAPPALPPRANGQDDYLLVALDAVGGLYGNFDWTKAQQIVRDGDALRERLLNKHDIASTKRRHSASSQVRCEICAPVRCVRARTDSR